MGVVTQLQNDKQDLVKQIQELYCWKEFYMRELEAKDSSKIEPKNIDGSIDTTGYIVNEALINDHNNIKSVTLLSLKVGDKDYPISRHYNAFKTEDKILRLKKEIDSIDDELKVIWNKKKTYKN